MTTTSSPVQYSYVASTDRWSDSNPNRIPVMREKQTFNYKGYEDVVVRNSNPLWKDQVARHTNASTYYFRSESTLTPISAQGNSVKGVYPNREFGDGYIRVAGNNGFDYTTDDTVRDIALARIKNKISNATQSVNVLVPLAEIHELRGTVKAAIGLTFGVMTELVRLKKRYGLGRGALKYASNLWLTYSFGIKPMLSDIKSISAAIDFRLKNQPLQIDRVSGSYKAVRTSSTRADQTGIPNAPLKVFCQTTQTVSYKFIAGWSFDIRNATDYTQAKHFGVTPPALITAAWELIPYSWVIDYFTTAGAFLDDTFLGQSGSAVYVVECRRALCESRWTGSFEPDFPDSTTVNGFVRPGSFTRFEFERTPLGALPSRILRFKTRDEIGLNSLNKLLNLTAILGK